MLRRLPAILSCFSLLLAVATAGMWVRSYWVRDMIYGSNDLSYAILERIYPMAGPFELTSDAGRFWFWYCGDIGGRFYYAATSHSFTTVTMDFSGPDVHRMAGFAISGLPPTVVVIPYWGATTFFLLLPGVRLMRDLHRRRRSRGFDLTSPPPPAPSRASPTTASTTATSPP